MLFTRWSPVTEAKKDEPDKDDFEDLSDSNTEEPEADEEPTDYTADTDTEETPDEPSDEPEEEESTDYTETVDEVEPDADTPPEEEPTDGETEPETDDNNDVVENQNNKVLIEDYLQLYYSCGSIVQKMDTIEKNNLVISQIVSKVVSNIAQLESLLFNYIRMEFAQKSYPQNLLRYNQFIEAMRINIEMLEKIGVFNGNRQNK